ncbi:MAG: YHYH protein, partial [Candidatus Marinimicrobia bacterium]|nr:YHYH protein [Candidatus Neomarinimicrobiota bacterium]
MKKYILILCIMALMACDTSTTMGTSGTNNNSDGTGTGGGNSGGNNTDLPAGFAKFIDAYTDVYVSGDYVIVETTGVPNHSSPYWGAGHPNYSSPQSGMNVNPNIITAQNFKFYIPLSPTVASSVSSTPLGSIGVSLSGVPFFNQYGGPNNQPLDNEIASFDNYYGHP